MWLYGDFVRIFSYQFIVLIAFVYRVKESSMSEQDFKRIHAVA